MGARSTASALAAARIIVRLDDARAVLGEAEWVELCLDTVVHVANADAGMLLGAAGDVAATCGLSADEARSMAREMRAGSGSRPGCNMLAVVSLASLSESGGVLGLCSKGHAESHLDLDAMTIVTTPLLSMIAHVSDAVCEVA